MGIIDGQAVSAAVTNPAFIDANADDTDTGKLDFANTDVASGPTVVNTQREQNSLNSFTGRSAGSAYNALPAWTSNETGPSTDNLFQRTDGLDERFSGTTGHTHDGTAGEGPQIVASDLDSVPYRGYVQQGVDQTGVTGSSTNVSSDMIGKSPSTGPTVLGVVVLPPENQVVIRQASGASEGDSYVDGSGNVVYGRITESALVWTLSYYVDIAGTETAYSFGSASDVRWYYQELYNPMVNPPVYSEFASIPSDNVTADVITATTTQQGKVSLATTSQSVGSSNSGGTANASVANADHAHQGVHSVAKSGDTALYSDVTFSAAGAVTLTQLGQNIEISATGGTTSPLTTKGDIWGYSTLDARVPVGTDGQVLVADSAETLGVKWGTPSSTTVDPDGPIYNGSNGLNLAFGSGLALGDSSGNDSFTELLLHFDNNLTDSSSNGLTVNQDGSNPASYATGEFSQALDVTAANTGFGVTNNAAFQFGSSDFTIECWLKPSTTINANNHQFLNKSTGGTTDWFWNYYSQQITFGAPSLSFQTATVLISIEDGNFHHVALTRSGNTVRQFVDGIVISTDTISGSISNTAGADLGIAHYKTNFSEQYFGYMDEIRISNGIARYTSNFTPQTAPFSSAAPTLVAPESRALQWVLSDSNVPAEAVASGVPVLDFWYEDVQEVWAFMTVPSSYVISVPITLKNMSFACPATTGKVLFRATTYLVRTGTEVLGSFSNSYTSTNVEVTVAGVANRITAIGDIDLTSSSGQINSITVQPGDQLSVKLVRLTSSESSPAADNARLIRFGGAPKFNV